MARKRLLDTLDEITRIQRRPPPLFAEPLTGDTMVSRPWINEPIDTFVGPMEHHIIAPTLRGDGTSAVGFGKERIETLSRAGGITIAPRGFSGHYHCTGRPLAANVYLGRGRLQRCSDEIGRGQVPELMVRLNHIDPKLFSILSLICDEAECAGLHQRLYMEQLIDVLCVHLLRAHTPFPLPERRRRGLSARQVRQVTAYMEERIEDSIGVQELAELVGLSRFHFCTAFRLATGFTPHQWLVRLRMEKARLLLQNPARSITEIALSVGYQTPSSFALAFRKALGVPPSRYRDRFAATVTIGSARYPPTPQ